MRYLKTFESNHKNTFDKITYTEWDQLIFGDDWGTEFDDNGEAMEWSDEDQERSDNFTSRQWVDFTPMEFEEVSKILGEIEWGWCYSSNFGMRRTMAAIESSSDRIFFQKHLKVNKIIDEWYLVAMLDDRDVADVAGGVGNYYKCDQFDGLIDCLKWICEL